MTQQLQIVVVEDGLGDAEILKRNLKGAGVVSPILHFDESEKALDYLLRRGSGTVRDEGQPVIVLLDLHLPRIDGVGVLRCLRASEDFDTLRVMVLTSDLTPRAEEECRALGCEDFFTKPLDCERFLELARDSGLAIQTV